MSTVSTYIIHTTQCFMIKPVWETTRTHLTHALPHPCMSGPFLPGCKLMKVLPPGETYPSFPSCISSQPRKLALCLWWGWEPASPRGLSDHMSELWLSKEKMWESGGNLQRKRPQTLEREKEKMVSRHKLQQRETKRGGSFSHPHITCILHCA